MKGGFNPMKIREAVNLSSGKHTSGKTGRHAKPTMGAGKQLGPAIGKEYPLTGSSKSEKTGGKFAGANGAKKARDSKKMG